MSRKHKNARRFRPMLEQLESRLCPTTTIFVDFGQGIGMGNTFSDTVANFRSILGPLDSGTDLTDDGYNGTDTLTFAPLNYDFNLDSIVNNADLTALANAVVPLAQ